MFEFIDGCMCMPQRLEKGLVQIYTGNGKGKTTAALGAAMRAIGHDLKVYMICFMKGRTNYGELKIADRISGFTIRLFGGQDHIDKNDITEEDRKYANNAFDHAKNIIQKGEHDIVILDEVILATDWTLIDLNSLIVLIENKPEHVELILTGRNACPDLINSADLVTQMDEIKHPYKKGVSAREGIEF